MQNFNPYQIIIGISFGVFSFFVWFFGPGLIGDLFSLPDGHPFMAISFMFLPLIFGIIGFSLSKGTNSQRIIYLLLGGGSIFVAVSIMSFLTQTKDPIDYFLPFSIGLMASIPYILGGIIHLFVDVILNFIKGMQKHL